MALNIYLMRHGETLFNIRRLEQGQCDSPLTSTGIHQAEEAKKYFKEYGIHFDACYSSTLERACDTLEIITPQPYERRHDLKEISLGTKEATNTDASPSYPYGDYFAQFGGEGLDAFTHRIYTAVSDIARKEDDILNKRTVLIVAHGMVMRVFLKEIGGPDKIPGNCAIAHIEYQDNKFHLMKIINPLENQNG